MEYRQALKIALDEMGLRKVPGIDDPRRLVLGLRVKELVRSQIKPSQPVPIRVTHLEEF